MSLIMRRKLEEVCHLCGTSSEMVYHCIEEEWIIPFDKEHVVFDDEDVARLKLILELKNNFGVNEEGIPIILHLIDQLNVFRHLKN